MNIQFDNEKDRELFIILLDNFSGMATEMELDEVEFINKLYECGVKK